ncbi:ABC transporter permease [Aeromicrobium sp.]|uniref:ABC transporter permease n=1 Tax=Aeromicrobium sp. TaxID=1871063 RepID=UPI002FC71DA5
MTSAKVIRALAQTVLAPLIAVVVSMIVTSVVVSISGSSVTEFWDVMLSWPSNRNWVNITNQTSMLFLAALAAAIAFRMNLFNIGVEGQYTLAAFVASAVAGAAWLPGKANVLLALVVAMVVGALWAGIAGVLKVTRGVSEVISTIMLNAIAGTMIGYLLNNHGDQYGQGRRTTPIPESSMMPGWAPWGAINGQIWTLCILAVIAGVTMSVVINRTRFGFDLRATGANEDAAIASGVKVKKMVVIAMLISGAIAGLVWMPALFGAAGYYGPPFQHMLGFTGIAVALLGRNRPLGIFFGAVLFAWLSERANAVSLETGVSPSVVQVTQGVVVLAVVIAYEVVRRWVAAHEQRQLTSAIGEEARA